MQAQLALFHLREACRSVEQAYGLAGVDAFKPSLGVAISGLEDGLLLLCLALEQSS